jgi:hypothetical protein
VKIELVAAEAAVTLADPVVRVLQDVFEASQVRPARRERFGGDHCVTPDSFGTQAGFPVVSCKTAKIWRVSARVGGSMPEIC